MKLTAVLAALGALVAAPAGAQDFDLCANRPGLASDGCVIPSGAAQLEMSFAELARDRRDGFRISELAIAPAMVRAGVGEALELRLAWTPWQRTVVRGGGLREVASGTGDLGIGAKLRLTADDAPLRIALEPSLVLPTGSRAVGQRRWSAAIALPMDGALGDFGFALTPAAALVPDAERGGRHLALGIAGSLGRDLTTRWSAALDLAHDIDFDPDGRSTATTLGLSSAYLVTPHLQLDAEVQVGLGGAAPDLALLAGFALRL